MFAKVTEDVLKRSSFAKLLALRKYYNPTTGVAEIQSAAKSQAIADFFETVWTSGPFSYLISFLRAKSKQKLGLIVDVNQFIEHPWAISPAMLKTNIKQIWFDNFSRAKGKLDSSAFEHVFFGEV